MAFIRATSNPEKLYVWGGINGVCWWTSAKNVTMPYSVFYGLFAAWDDGFQENVEYNGATIDLTEDFRHCVSYNDVSFVLWLVTLEHIAANIRRRKQRRGILGRLFKIAKC